MNSNADSDPNEALASKVPVGTSMPPHYYQFTFLPPGTYTVAFTCQAALDNPDQPDPSVVTLTRVATAAVIAEQTATVDTILGSIQGQITSTPDSNRETRACISPQIGVSVLSSFAMSSFPDGLSKHFPYWG